MYNWAMSHYLFEKRNFLRLLVLALLELGAE